MTHSVFDDFVLQHQIIGFFDNPLTLKSGRQSHFYVNWRRATNDAYLLDSLTDHVRDFLLGSTLKFESLIGVPEGASKTAVLTSIKIARQSPNFGLSSHSVPMGRAKPKSHGSPEDKFFIGYPKGPTVILEDTITTGMSLVAFIRTLKQAGVQVVAAVGLTDRMETRDDGRSVSAFIGDEFDGEVQYLAMSQADVLLPKAILKTKPKQRVVDSLIGEFDQFGVNPLNLGEI